MILSYRDRRTQAFAEGTLVRDLHGVDRQAWRRLEVLEAAASLDDLRSLPGSGLQALRGDRRARYAIGVHGKLRICFEWPNGDAGPTNVEIVDDQ